MNKKFLLILAGFIAIGSNAQTLLRSKDVAHEGGVTCLVVSTDGEQMLTGGVDMKTFLWNVKNGDKLKGALKHNDRVNAVAINSNNKLYASGSADMKIRVVDIEQGIPVRILSEHTASVTSLAFNPVNDYLASGGKDNLIKIWDNSKSKVSVLTLRGHAQEVSSLVFSPDGKMLCSASPDNTIRIWDATTGALIKNISAGSKGVTSLCYSSDGKFIVSGGANGTIVVWDPSSGNKITELAGYKAQVNAVTISPDAQYIAAAGADKKIMIWKIQGGKAEKEFKAHEMDITGLSFTSKGGLLLSASLDASIKVWDVNELNIGDKKFVKSEQPSNLSVSGFTLKDNNNNGILEASEKTGVTFNITNNGSSAAFNVIAKLAMENPNPEISFAKEFNVGNLEAGKTQTVTIPLVAGSNLSSGNVTMSVNVTDASGFISTSQKITFQTGGANSYSYVMVTGQSYSSATGKADIGAPISLKLKIKNITKSEVKNFKVNFLLPEHVFATNKVSELIPGMSAGEEKEIQLDFYADKTFTLPEIKMGVDIQGVAFSNAKDIILKVKMNEKLPVNEDYSGAVLAQATQIEEKAEATSDHPLMRGGGDALKGLNVNVSKDMVIGNYYALIIGVDKYKAPWPALGNAVNDAKALEKTLRSYYKFDNFKTLYNEQATRDGIIKELEWLVANVKERDNVFIYYSGHGEYKKDLGKGFWVPVDAEGTSTSKFISNSDIQTYINGIKSKHTLLISDACFSGDIFRGNTITTPFEETEKYYREVHGLVSRQALTSGGLEPVMDGGKEGHSVFAYYLLKTLEGNQGKYFDASQLYTKIKIPVINNSEQTPKFSPIKNAGDEGGQFIFIKK